MKTLKIMKMSKIVALMLIFVSIVTARNVDFIKMKAQQVNQYLYKFGYLKTKHPTQEQKQKALSKFQEGANLVATGVIDEDTVNQMDKPRCGDPDNVEEDRVKRFVLKQSRWRKTYFTFGIYKYPDNGGTEMTHSEIWDVITEAFEHWENVTNIRYKGIGQEIVDKESVDIAIGWGKYDHGDDDPFDGPSWLDGNTIAHGFYPEFGGDIHFDDSELWGLSTSTKTGYYDVTTYELFQVALHEIGHTLGLAHSKDLNAVMWPYEHEDWTPKKGLSQDDIKGVQALYGEPTGNKETVAYGNYESSICHITKFDAIVHNDTFFVGDQFWKVDTDYNYVLPRNISDNWEDLPGDLDAAVYNNAVFYFFKGDLVYAYYQDYTQYIYTQYGYPKQISEAFPGFPNNLDGAFSFQNDVYYVKGDYFGRDFKETQFPSHPSVSAPFDDVQVEDNLIKFIKNGKQFLYRDMEDNEITLSSVDDLSGPKFENTKMHAIDLRYDWYQCKKDYIYDLP